MDYTIRKMLRSDIDPITTAFVPMNKTREQYERYFDENQAGDRVTLVAVTDEGIVGYANVLWRSYYEPFRRDGIPEINDLNVVEEYRDQGIGRALIAQCENVVRESEKATIGIGVGLTPDYSAAQHLYPTLGYISDGRGVHTSPHGDETYFLKDL